MTILRVGTNEKYSEGWDAIFGQTPKGKAGASKKASGKTKAQAKAGGKAKSRSAKKKK